MTPTIAVFIPIIAIVMGIGAGMWAMFLSYRKRKDIFALYHQERMAAIEKGVDLAPLPEAFFAEDSKGKSVGSPRRSLLVGLQWAFIGLGLIIALRSTGESDVSLFGLIPLGIGLAYLIYYFVEGRKAPDFSETQRKS